MDKELYGLMSQHEDKHWWFSGRRKIIKSILDKFFKPSPSNRILEVGCGTGGNLALLSAYGQLAAVELNEAALDTAAGRNICPVFQGALPDHLPLDDRYDLVCMLDVLEHIDEDVRSLKNLASRLNTNGLLLITVPSYMFLWGAHDELHHHKRRYTRKELEQLLATSGLTVLHATYFNTLLFPAILAIRLVNRLFNTNWASGVNTPSPWINRLLQQIFELEIPLLNRMRLPFGVSLLVIAKKSTVS